LEDDFIGLRLASPTLTADDDGLVGVRLVEGELLHFRQLDVQLELEPGKRPSVRRGREEEDHLEGGKVRRQKG
jgi:hypothetical protein